ncbi:MAG: recombinase family protein [Eubacteriales bacterium]
MARVSRKINPINIVNLSEKNVMYNVGVYIRISVKDLEGKGDSLENQKNIIANYVEQYSDMQIIKIYEDDGLTGTDFQRPAFIEMLEDAKRKKINCIVVKDLSRFGRSYIETGNYMEKVFPFLGIRFIAISDYYDSKYAEETLDGYSIPLKNLLNEIYAREVSKKVSASQFIMQENGEYVGGKAPYGYRRSKTQKNKLEICLETAPIVRQIFKMRAEGISHQKIVLYLDEQGILCPSKFNNVSNSKHANWNSSSVRRILANEMYVGNMVQRKTVVKKYMNQKLTTMNEDDYIVVKNTHEPIVSEERFLICKNMRTKNVEYHLRTQEKFRSIVNQPNLLKGIIYCEHCGTRLVRVRRIVNVNNDIEYHYKCENHSYRRCEVRMIREEVVLDTVIETLRLHMKQVEVTKLNVETMIKTKEYHYFKEQIKKQLITNNQDMKKVQDYKRKLLEEYLVQMVSESDYISFNKKYDKDIEECEMKSKQLCEQLNTPMESAGVKDWIKFYADFSKEQVTPELLKSLVKSVKIDCNHSISICLKYADHYQDLKDTIENLEDRLYETI